MLLFAFAKFQTYIYIYIILLDIMLIHHSSCVPCTLLFCMCVIQLSNEVVIAIKDACKGALSQLEENLIGHHPESLDEKNMPSGKKDIHGSSQQADPMTKLKMEKEKVGEEQVRHFPNIKNKNIQLQCLSLTIGLEINIQATRVMGVVNNRNK